MISDKSLATVVLGGFYLKFRYIFKLINQMRSNSNVLSTSGKINIYIQKKL
jgi:hypothetical protein